MVSVYCITCIYIPVYSSDNKDVDLLVCNPSNTEATSVLNTRTQRFLKTT